MEFVTKIENMVAGWTKSVPHLPVAGQKWLAQNVWWIVLIGTIAMAISLLFAISALFQLMAFFGSVNSVLYSYAFAGVTGWTIASSIVSLVFSLAIALIMALSIKPLQLMQKKGWALLFVAWLANAVSVVVGSILSFSVFGFLFGLIFGAIFLAISGYFIFEIRGQFAQAARPAKTAKKVTA